MGALNAAHARKVPDKVQDALMVAAQVEGRGEQALLAFTWTNQGTTPLLLLTHADTDDDVMFDAIEITQGGVRAALKAPRKSVAPRFCVLPAGHHHTVRIGSLRHWLQRVGVDPGQPWQVAYHVAEHVEAPALAMPLCGSQAAPDDRGAAPLWHGHVLGPSLQLW